MEPAKVGEEVGGGRGTTKVLSSFSLSSRSDLTLLSPCFHFALTWFSFASWHTINLPLRPSTWYFKHISASMYAICFLRQIIYTFSQIICCCKVKAKQQTIHRHFGKKRNLMSFHVFGF